MPGVVFVMIDGLRPDALAAARCPNLESVRARGASTLRARSVMPSVTLPCHMSIFHSVPPTRHGVTTNEFTPMARPIPGLIERLKAHDRRAAFFYNWEPLRNLSLPGSLFSSFFRDVHPDDLVDSDQLIADTAARTIAVDKLDFAFVYFGVVDLAGHFYGWMSDDYLKQAERADAALGTVLAALPADAAVIVHSDHGGHDRNHGTELPEDMTIPWMAAEPGIRAGYDIAGPVSLLDTAPTVARLLGLPPHPEWEGRVIEEMLE